MRAHTEDVRKDQQEKCFVCGIDRDVFEQHGLSFERHTRDDHYMWNYIFLKIYLEQKDPTEYTGQEHHIRQLMKEQRWAAFFPIKKALAIQGLDTTQKKDVHTMITQIDQLRQRDNVLILTIDPTKVAQTSTYEHMWKLEVPQHD